MYSNEHMSSIKWIVVVTVIITVVAIIGLVLSVSFFKDNTIKQSSLDYGNNNKQSISKTNLENKLTKKNDSSNSAGEDTITKSITYIDTPYVTEYSLPNNTWPNGIMVDRNGLVWIAGTKSHTLISFDPKQGKIKFEYSITEVKKADDGDNNVSNKSNRDVRMVWAIVEDNDGSIWFSQTGPNPLWRFDPNTEKLYLISSVKAAPFQMKVDHKTGNIWFTTFQGGTLGVIQKIENNKSSNSSTTMYYNITEFRLGKDIDSSGLFLDSDSSVWITESLNHKLVKFNPVVDISGRIIDIVKILEIPPSSASSTSISILPSPSPSDNLRLFSVPSDLVVFDNKSVWLTEHGASFITHYNIESHNVTHFPTSKNPPHPTTLPFWIRLGIDDDNSLWFNEHAGNRIAFFNTTDMTLTEYEIPTRDPSNGYIANALNLAIDPTDSNKVWFSEFNQDKIGIVDRSKFLIPFNIYSSDDKVVVHSTNKTNQIAPIDVNITKNTGSRLLVDDDTPNNIVLKTSSSMIPSGDFVNMTAKFSQDTIDLSRINETTQVQLLLRNNNNSDIPIGNYTLAISATDGTVTRSTFLDLVVE